MTIAAFFWRRKFPRLPPGTQRLFEVEPGTRLRGDCNWQADRRLHPALVLIHGLEGSSESGYMLGTAEKAFENGFNVIRMNQRNCGGTEDLTETLYHSGLSGDFRFVIRELIENDDLPEIFVAGFSMGGNLALKMAAEFGSAAPDRLRGIVAVSPSLDLTACADALAKPRNFFYEQHFVRRLRKRMALKAKLFPARYPINGLNRVRSVREFDELFTAKFCGFLGAEDYYRRSSAIAIVSAIRVPTLIIAAKDDPFVPFSSFLNQAIHENPQIVLVMPEFGGHCGFISRERGEERFWSEATIVDFCKEKSRLAQPKRHKKCENRK